MNMLLLLLVTQALAAENRFGMNSTIYFNDGSDVLTPVQIKYEKSFPHCAPWPDLPADAKVEISPTGGGRRNAPFHKWRPDAKEVRKLISKYVVVAEKEWRMVSHVAMSDRTGFLQLPDKTKVRWLLRPAGIGMIIYPDGGVVYLLACCLEKMDERPCS